VGATPKPCGKAGPTKRTGARMDYADVIRRLAEKDLIALFEAFDRPGFQLTEWLNAKAEAEESEHGPKEHMVRETK